MYVQLVVWDVSNENCRGICDFKIYEGVDVSIDLMVDGCLCRCL